MKEKRCPRCKQTKPIEEFNWRIKDKGQRHSECKVCCRAIVKQHYQDNKQYYKDKKKKNNKRYTQIAKAYVDNYLATHPCIICGETDKIVLVFHHRDPKLKLAEISNLKYNMASPCIKKLITEIEKCDILCANCHTRLHYKSSVSG